ncbi:MAG: hypothetical protein RBT19_02220 [Tenuifilaceae bacterium]|jgi:hypothetical protein|nr:hypothetical protein [Tenuifilaceae bacterium]
MRNLLGIIILLFGVSLMSSAQISPKALGLRFGSDGAINGAELSYQKKMSDANRVELDLGAGFSANHSRIVALGMYHWHWNIQDGFNWFVGPGVGLGLYTYDDADGYFNIGLGGQIGIEYNLNTHDIPLMISVDARPMWDFLGSRSGFGWGAALGVRYTW